MTPNVTVAEFKARFAEMESVILSEGEYLGELDIFGTPHGEGIMTFFDLASYAGEWKNGRREGTGLYAYANGDTYHGAWKNNVPDGQGTFAFANGGYAKGIWSRGALKNAIGVYVAPDGTRYNASWVNNVMHKTPLQ